MKKICELIVNISIDREKVILGLVNSGYTVKCEKRQKKDTWMDSDKNFVLIVYDGGDAE